MSRTVFYRVAVGANAGACLLNVIMVGLNLHAGTSIVANTLAAGFSAAATFGLVAVNQWFIARMDYWAANLRAATAAATTQEDILAKIKAGTLNVTLLEGEDSGRLH
jgi:hypothetical protein